MAFRKRGVPEQGGHATVVIQLTERSGLRELRSVNLFHG
jgi:hypothetical protein